MSEDISGSDGLQSKRCGGFVAKTPAKRIGREVVRRRIRLWRRGATDRIRRTAFLLMFALQAITLLDLRSISLRETPPTLEDPESEEYWLKF